MSGKPVHFELPSEDAARARGFWSGLFGWEFADSAMEGFDYRMTQFDNGTAAAVYPDPGGERGTRVYFVSEDLDADIARVQEFGGKADQKQEIPGTGWFTHCHDTEGNRFSLFQGGPSADA